VILVDVNILVYATVDTFEQHPASRRWLDRQLNNTRKIGFPWPALLGFLRIATSPRILPRPVAMGAAWQQVEGWLACEPSWIPQPTERHADILGKLLAQPGVHGHLVPDAHLAALAIEHGLTLCSTDGDFARFPGLRWENPLIGE
jgi:uncharacterized protein